MKKTTQRQGAKSGPYPDETAILRRVERAVRANSDLQAEAGLELGIGDDAALWTPTEGCETVLTTDWFLEGRHFLRKVHPPDSVGWKCLARAVSDVAAMGGEPRCCLVSLALPASCTLQWLDLFLSGLARCARKLRCPVAGGDTTRSEKILINVCVIGEVKEGTALLRSGARSGDRIFVSGTLGEGELGLEKIRKRKNVEYDEDPSLRKHLYPVPRIALGRWLAENGLASAAMDLSDGLSSDLPRLCEASRAGAVLCQGKLPTAAGVFAREFDESKRLQAALHGGDDYELLFCVPAKATSTIPRRFAGLSLTEIGEITEDKGITLIDSSGRKSALPAKGWDPFRR